MIVVGERIDILHVAFLADGVTPLGGLLGADFSAVVLRRPPTGLNWEVATEAATFEGEVVGATGRYGFHLTPLQAADYEVQIQCTAVGAEAKTYSYQFDVVTAGAEFTPTYDDAFCAETDIKRQSGMQFSATSRPTSSDVAGFARLRAAEIMAQLAEQGIVITPDVGAAPIDTSSQRGVILRDNVRLANALGAAMDAVDAAYMGIEPTRSEKARDIEKQYRALLKATVAMAATAYSTSRVLTPYSEGEVAAYETPSGTTAVGIPFTMEGDR